MNPKPPTNPRTQGPTTSAAQKTLIGAVAVVFFLSPLLTMRLHPNRYEGGRSERTADLVQRNTSAIALILGEVRAGMSDLMYIKTERYLDRGVAYYPHIDMDALSSEGKVKTTDEAAREQGLRKAHERDTEHPTREEDSLIAPPLPQLDHQHEHEGETPGQHAELEHEGEEKFTPTIIRTAADDFRGFIGYLERHVKPWRDPRESHQHSDGTELLPWFRLQTLSDPHHVRSYLIGAWWLAGKSEVQLREALDFVDEGIRNNPQAYQLYLMKGQILRKLDRQTEATDAFRQAADLAMERRPPRGDENPNAEELGWDSYKEQDARTAARMTVLMEKTFRDPQTALALAHRYLQHLEHDGILERQIRILTGQEPDPALQPKPADQPDSPTAP